VERGVEIMNFFQSVAIGIAVTAVGWDLATRRIPNVLTFGATFAAVVVHGWTTGWTGAEMSLAGWLVGAAFFFPVFALGGMGAGDVKLIAALGAWLGPAAVAWVALYSGIAGGVMALAVAMCSGYLKKAFTNLWCLLMFWRVAGVRPAPELMLSTQQGPRLAYAVPVLAGLVVAVWFR
jgi:prepilin peptidase CpaA